MMAVGAKTKIALLAFLCMGAVAGGFWMWKTKPNDTYGKWLSSDELRRCPIHQVSMKQEKVKASQIIALYTPSPEYEEAKERFLYAGNLINSGYAPEPYQWIIITYCPQCRLAHKAWIDEQKQRVSYYDHDLPAALVELLEEVEKMEMLGAFAVGIGGDPGRFYEISLQMKQELNQQQTLKLLKDENANVVALGLVLLAYDLDEHLDHFSMLANDKRKIQTLIACSAANMTVGDFSRMLLSDLEARSMYIDAEVPVDSVKSLPEAH